MGSNRRRRCSEHDRRCIQFARRWGCGRLDVLNLYALCSTDPIGLRRHANPVGPENDAVIERVVRDALALHKISPTARRSLQAQRESVPIVLGWGQNANSDRVADVIRLLRRAGLPVCLRKNKDGTPAYPLYLPTATSLRAYP